MTDAPLILTFCWSYAHAPSDTVLFDVCLGTANPPPLVDSMIVDTVYDPGPLLPDTTYFWRVIAHLDTTDSASSPVWRFTTRSTFVFPLAVGNTWQYSRMFYAHNFDPDSLAYLGFDTVVGNKTTEIERIDTLLGSQETYVFHTVWTESGSSGDGYSYRNNTSDGLYIYAYQFGGGVGPPKVALREGTYLLFKGMRFSSISELLDWVHSRMDITMNVGRLVVSDSIRYENPPVRDLAYPLEVGQRWVYRDSTADGDPWKMGKEVVGIENVTTPAITADCFKIRWYWDLDDNGLWDPDIVAYDYLAAIGVLKRQYELIGLVITDYSSPDSLGTLDVTDVYELTGYELE